MNDYERLISRLDAFIRKYYANMVIRGTLVFLSCLCLFFLTASVSEYYFYLPVWVRMGVMGVFMVLGTAALVAWVAVPLTKMVRLGKVISHDRAASIIGAHFPEISDKLLNILQLKRSVSDSESRELAEASINQKISRISVVPFNNAVDLSRNRRYLPYLLPSVLVIILIFVFAPNIFSESSKRLLAPATPFEKPAPFNFVVKNPNLNAVKNGDFVLTIEVTGNSLPAEVFLETADERIPMQPEDKHSFQYTFRNLTTAVPFRFWAAGFRSQPYTLNVLQKPILKAFKVQITYPAYTGMKNEVRTSLGDMTLPVGTYVDWGMATEFTDNAAIRFGDGAPVPFMKSATLFAGRFRFMNDTAYSILLMNHASGVSDSFNYRVQVIPDQYPVVRIQQFKDSITGKQILITGTAGDDYGISKLTFNYEITEKEKKVAGKSIPITFIPGTLANFQQYFDIGSLSLLPGQSLNYYVEAWDNDGVHGSKASRSEMMSYRMYDAKQIDSAINENSRQINSGISNSAEKTNQLQSEYKDLQTKMLQSENMDWDRQQNLQEMMNKQNELKTQLENIKQRFEEQKKQSEQKNYSDNVKEKQQDLEKQMDNLLNKELKEQLDKLRELMQKLNKEQAVEAMKQMQQENKLFKMDMERMQALMKKLEMQMHMEDMANKLDKMAEKQMALKDATDSGKKTDDQLAKEQKDLKDQLDKLMKNDLKETEKLAKETKEEKQLDEPKEDGKEAGEEMEKSENSLSQKKKDKASQSQKKAASKMSQMAKKMRQNADGMDMEEIEIDIKATRQVLSNLIRLSFDQEDLMGAVRRTPPTSQAYVKNQDEQNRLHNNSVMIRDSMFALSKRISKMSETINKETTDLEHNMQLTVDELENRNTGAAVAHQQYIMTHTNNLALMLNEVLANLMQMQSQPKDGGGSGSCSKPGGSNPKPGAGKQLSDIITEQQQLGDAMQQMQQGKGKKPGQKDGGQKPGGQKPGQGSGGGQGDGQGEGQSGGK